MSHSLIAKISHLFIDKIYILISLLFAKLYICSLEWLKVKWEFNFRCCNISTTSQLVTPTMLRKMTQTQTCDFDMHFHSLEKLYVAL